MKKLFVAALVLNLVVWLWARREAPEIIDGLLLADVGVIRLVDEAAVRTAPARKRSAADSPAAPDGGRALAQASSGDGVEPGRPSGLPVADADLQALAPSVPRQAAEAAQPQPLTAQTPTSPPASPVPTPPSLPPLETSAEDAEAADASPMSSPAPHAPANSDSEVLVGDALAPSPPEPTTEDPAGADAPDAATPPGPEARAAEVAPAAETSPGPTDDLLTAPAAESRVVCETVGPFPQRGMADAFIASLPTAVASNGVREERASRPARHWVLGPVQASREAVAAYLAALQAAGIRDAWRAQSGALAGRLVVGVFSTEENARRHAAMLAGKGVATEIRRLQGEETRWWVDTRHTGSDTTYPDVPDGVQVAPRHCGRVAAP